MSSRDEDLKRTMKRMQEALQATKSSSKKGSGKGWYGDSEAHRFAAVIGRIKRELNRDT